MRPRSAALGLGAGLAAEAVDAEGEGAAQRRQHVGVALVAEGEGQVEEAGEAGAAGAHRRPLVAEQAHALDGAEVGAARGEHGELRLLVERPEEAALVGVAVDEARPLALQGQHLAALLQQPALELRAAARLAEAPDPGDRPARLCGAPRGPCLAGAAAEALLTEDEDAGARAPGPASPRAAGSPAARSRRAPPARRRAPTPPRARSTGPRRSRSPPGARGCRRARRRGTPRRRGSAPACAPPRRPSRR